MDVSPPMPPFVPVSLPVVLAPGADSLDVAARRLAEGRGAGLLSPLGVSAGLGTHTLAAALGLAALLADAAAAFDLVRWLGAAYLLWLGLRMLRRHTPPGEVARRPRTTAVATFAQGFVSNVLNPKVALLLLVFMPQFAQPATGAGDCSRWAGCSP